MAVTDFSIFCSLVLNGQIVVYFNSDDMNTLIQGVFHEHDASYWEYALVKKRVQTNTRNWKSRAIKNMTVGLASAIPSVYLG